MTSILLISFLLGAAIGSFVNVLVLRERKKEKVTGRSYCPHCKKQLRWYELIPLLSFFLQAGRCKKCKEKISLQYPLVELGTGLLFALLAWNFFLSPYILVWLWLVSILLVALFVYDLKYMELPDTWVLILSLLVLAGTLLFYRDTIVLRALSGLALSFFYFGMHFFSRGRWIGGGDVKIAFPLGMLAGWPGLLTLLGLAYVSGALIGIYFLIIRQAKGETALPFGPFLIAGSLISFLYSDSIITWYLSLLS